MKKLLCAIAALTAMGTANASAITDEITARDLSGRMVDNPLLPPAGTLAGHGIFEYLFESAEARLYGQLSAGIISASQEPEPSSAAIIASGLAVLVLARRRPRREPN